MADDVPLIVDQNKARKLLDLGQEITDNTPILALLPGSRAREIDSLLAIFLQTFAKLKEKEPDLRAVIPAVNEARMQQIKQTLSENTHKHHIYVSTKPARDAMIAANVVLLASGTAALEAMLCKRPMVVAYIMPSITYMMMKRMYKPDYFALPNILANEQLVPEYLQEDVNACNLASELNRVWRQDPAITRAMIDKFTSIHKSLKCNADVESAKAVLGLTSYAVNAGSSLQEHS